jgi:hypothetical protein
VNEDAAIMLRLFADGRVEVLVLHVQRPRELGRLIQRFAATLVEHPGFAGQLAQRAAP